MSIIPKPSMSRFKEVARISSRGNNKELIFVICFSLIVLIFVIYEIFTSSVLWRLPDGICPNNVRNVFFDNNDREAIVLTIRDHTKSQPFHGEKLIHLDLKGAPPLVSYLKKFFPYIKNLGATGVLIEYEDMFPYNEELEDIRALNAYTPSDIKTILNLAEANDLQVIPLIQTFGHLEFVLKLEKYEDLREVDAFPQMLCPSHEKAHSVIHKMIDQVMKAHPKSKYVHIGGDEVMYLGQCDKCKTEMKQNGWTTSDLFLNHMKSIALYIKKTYPGVRPIMWSGMIDETSEKKFKKSQISSLIDLMVWMYTPNVSDYVTENLLELYAKLFKSIWIASAFKGATGVSQILTNANYHLANHMAWMDIVDKWKQLINFKGIALTGWQRYDHFARLCELLPVAIPSLTLSMSYIGNSEKEVTDLVKVLVCDSSRNSRISDFPELKDLLDILGKSKSFGNSRICDFPGLHVYKQVLNFSSLSSMIQSKEFSISSSGWFSVYNIVHKFSNPDYVKNFEFESWPVDLHLKKVDVIEKSLKIALSEIYDEHTVEEWILTNVAPLKIRLAAFASAKEALLEQKVWPRRPLLNKTDDLYKTAREICTSGRKFGCALLLH